MITIAIIGAGQLGSRHLQALASLREKAAIYVIDPSADSLKTSEERFKEVSSNFKGEISFHTSIDLPVKKLDVVIIATSSKHRREVIETLLDRIEVRYLILEKFLFTREEDYAAVEALLAAKKVKAWVNCPRRMMSFYRELQKNSSGNVHVAVTGNDWGLGCNSIHLLDLFAFLTGTQAIAISNALLDKKIIESRRSGYIEFTGTITGQTDQHSLRITSFAGNPSGLVITIDTPGARYFIEEGANAKYRKALAANDWKWEEGSFEMPYQSQLTNLLIEELSATGNCSLPSYSESSALHLLLLKSFISFLQKTNNDNSIRECPIT